LLQPRNVGIQEMEMASELSQKSRKTIFGMIDPWLKGRACVAFQSQLHGVTEWCDTVICGQPISKLIVFVPAKKFVPSMKWE